MKRAAGCFIALFLLFSLGLADMFVEVDYNMPDFQPVDSVAAFEGTWKCEYIHINGKTFSYPIYLQELADQNDQYKITEGISIDSKSLLNGQFFIVDGNDLYELMGDYYAKEGTIDDSELKMGKYFKLPT